MNTTKADRTLIVIPARLQSKRLPDIPLLIHKGKTLLDYTYEQAKKTIAGKVVVATSDQEIIDYCTDKGLDFVQTVDCTDGTMRCFQAYAQLISEGYTCVINWQVDEPLIDVGIVTTMINQIKEYNQDIFTLVAPITEEQKQNPNITKAIVPNSFLLGAFVIWNKCHWFTRSPIMENSFGHCGIYGFSNHSLLEVANIRQSKAAKAEQLEQLSWIENGIDVKSVLIKELPLSINTPEDWTQFCNEN